MNWIKENCTNKISSEISKRQKLNYTPMPFRHNVNAKPKWYSEQVKDKYSFVCTDPTTSLQYKWRYNIHGRKEVYESPVLQRSSDVSTQFGRKDDKTPGRRILFGCDKKATRIKLIKDQKIVTRQPVTGDPRSCLQNTTWQCNVLDQRERRKMANLHRRSDVGTQSVEKDDKKSVRRNLCRYRKQVARTKPIRKRRSVTRKIGDTAFRNSPTKTKTPMRYDTHSRLLSRTVTPFPLNKHGSVTCPLKSADDQEVLMTDAENESRFVNFVKDRSKATDGLEISMADSTEKSECNDMTVIAKKPQVVDMASSVIAQETEHDIVDRVVAINPGFVKRTITSLVTAEETTHNIVDPVIKNSKFIDIVTSSDTTKKTEHNIADLEIVKNSEFIDVLTGSSSDTEKEAVNDIVDLTAVKNSEFVDVLNASSSNTVNETEHDTVDLAVVKNSKFVDTLTATSSDTVKKIESDIDNFSMELNIESPRLDFVNAMEQLNIVQQLAYETEVTDGVKRQSTYDYSDILGLKWLFDSHQPNCDYTNVVGLKELFMRNVSVVETDCENVNSDDTVKPFDFGIAATNTRNGIARREIDRLLVSPVSEVENEYTIKNVSSMVIPKARRTVRFEDQLFDCKVDTKTGRGTKGEGRIIKPFNFDTPATNTRSRTTGQGVVENVLVSAISRGEKENTVRNVSSTAIPKSRRTVRVENQLYDSKVDAKINKGTKGKGQTNAISNNENDDNTSKRAILRENNRNKGRIFSVALSESPKKYNLRTRSKSMK